jgi:hypothetical protein
MQRSRKVVRKIEVGEIGRSITSRQGIPQVIGSLAAQFTPSKAATVLAATGCILVRSCFFPLLTIALVQFHPYICSKDYRDLLQAS